jgi:hypothetical protein
MTHGGRGASSELSNRLADCYDNTHWHTIAHALFPNVIDNLASAERSSGSQNRNSGPRLFEPHRSLDISGRIMALVCTRIP